MGKLLEKLIKLVDGLFYVSKALTKKRIKTCEVCNLFDSRQRRCNSCGCFMDIKTKLRLAKCPSNLWK